MSKEVMAQKKNAAASHKGGPSKGCGSHIIYHIPVPYNNPARSTSYLPTRLIATHTCSISLYGKQTQLGYVTTFKLALMKRKVFGAICAVRQGPNLAFSCESDWLAFFRWLIISTKVVKMRESLTLCEYGAFN